MPKKWKLAEAFAHFNATAKNKRWSRSARSADGKTVIILLWKHLLKLGVKPIVYDTFNRPDPDNWINSPGNRERVDNLIWARDRCDGLFRVVVTVAEDVNAEPRKIKDCYPKDDWVMRITDLNEKTSEFRAVKVDE